MREGEWKLAQTSENKLLERLIASNLALIDFVEKSMYRGPESGLNEAFLIDEAKYQELLSEDPNCASVMQLVLRGRDVKRWRVQSPRERILYIPWDFNLEQYPSIRKHLQLFADKLSERPEVQQGRYPWFALRRYAPEYRDEFLKPKIVWGNLANQPEFALDISGAYVNTPASIITAPHEKMLFLLGLLNSNVTHYFMKFTGAARQNGYIEYKPAYVARIPIPDVTPPILDKIAAKARACLDAAAQGNAARVTALEGELNALVYQAYGLTDEEISVIEGAVGK